MQKNANLTTNTQKYLLHQTCQILRFLTLNYNELPSLAARYSWVSKPNIICLILTYVPFSCFSLSHKLPPFLFSFWFYLNPRLFLSTRASISLNLLTVLVHSKHLNSKFKSGRDAIFWCLQWTSPLVVDQSVLSCSCLSLSLWCFVGFDVFIFVFVFLFFVGLSL